jgi:hypothetical protein
MSNSKKTIKVKTEFSNMYGDGKNLNIGKNKPVNELLKNIPNSNLNDTNQTNNFDDLERKETLRVPMPISEEKIRTSPFKMIYIAMIIIILLLVSLLVFYKDVVINYFNSFSKNDTAANNAVIAATSKVDNTSAKVDVTSAKVDATSAKIESTSEKIDNLDKKVDNLINKKGCDTDSKPKSGVNTLNEKLNNMSPHKKSTLTEDAYCYIGYDNGQRECMEAYAGDVCMSGEIFPSLDICINPKLRP